MEEVAGFATSVHVGCFTNDFIFMNYRDAQQIPKNSGTGTPAAILSNRLSWFYDLRETSMTVDTACSSGLVAPDLACNGPRSGKARYGGHFPQARKSMSDTNMDKAMVAGANLIQSAELNISLSKMNFISTDGRCHSFDHRGSGCSWGEGFGVLVLKPLSRAVRDGTRPEP